MRRLLVGCFVFAFVTLSVAGLPGCDGGTESGTVQIPSGTPGEEVPAGKGKAAGKNVKAVPKDPDAR